MANIVIVENQYRQFDDIRIKLAARGHSCYPQRESYIPFTDWVRIYLDSRYITGNNPGLRKELVWNKITKAISDHESELMIIDHKLSGSFVGGDGIDLAFALREISAIPIMFLSRTETNSQEVKTKLKNLENFKWVEKGYAGQRIWDNGYFENHVIDVIPTMISRGISGYEKIVRKLANSELFRDDDGWKILHTKLLKALESGQLTPQQRNAIDRFEQHTTKDASARRSLIEAFVL